MKKEHGNNRIIDFRVILAMAMLLILGFSSSLLVGCQYSQEVSREKNVEMESLTNGEITWARTLELQYATGFSVDYYSDENIEGDENYCLLRIEGEGNYVIVLDSEENTLTENISAGDTSAEKTAMETIATTNSDKFRKNNADIKREFEHMLSQEVVVIAVPQNVYLVASQVMDMLISLNAMDQVGFSALNAKDWYLEEATRYMEEGKILYAGKYSAPDYEMLLLNQCDLAIENTMIYHSPKVREKLESVGIPVIVDRSSYETNPYGRTEWVKLYGALLGREAEAVELFDAQVRAYEAIGMDTLSADKVHPLEQGASVEQGVLVEHSSSIDAESPTVAFFYVASNGSVKVRKSNDYVPQMIRMAGGEYIFSNLGEDEDNSSSTVNMQMESFYAVAKDADYIVYNSTIEGELESLEDFLAIHPLFVNMKAVKEGHVYCTSKNLYQSSMATGQIISDFHAMFENSSDMVYIYSLEY